MCLQLSFVHSTYLKVEDGVGGVRQLWQVVRVVAHLGVVVVEGADLGREVVQILDVVTKWLFASLVLGVHPYCTLGAQKVPGHFPAGLFCGWSRAPQRI